MVDNQAKANLGACSQGRSRRLLRGGSVYTERSAKHQSRGLCATRSITPYLIQGQAFLSICATTSRSIYFSPCSKFDIFVFYKTNSICFRLRSNEVCCLTATRRYKSAKELYLALPCAAKHIERKTLVSDEVYRISS